MWKHFYRLWMRYFFPLRCFLVFFIFFNLPSEVHVYDIIPSRYITMTHQQNFTFIGRIYIFYFYFFNLVQCLVWEKVFDEVNACVSVSLIVCYIIFPPDRQIKTMETIFQESLQGEGGFLSVWREKLKPESRNHKRKLRIAKTTYYKNYKSYELRKLRKLQIIKTTNCHNYESYELWNLQISRNYESYKELQITKDTNF